MKKQKKKRRNPSIDPKRPYGFVRVTDQAMFDLPKVEALRRLVVAVRDVRGHRQTSAYESPESQDAWDRLHLAVLEAEQVLGERTSSARKK